MTKLFLESGILDARQNGRAGGIPGIQPSS